jgi:hypothetical protein
VNDYRSSDYARTDARQASRSRRVHKLDRLDIAWAEFAQCFDSPEASFIEVYQQSGRRSGLNAAPLASGGRGNGHTHASRRGSISLSGEPCRSQPLHDVVCVPEGLAFDFRRGNEFRIPLDLWG